MKDELGTKVCQREGCNNRNCRRYSEKYGYLCYDCFEELVMTWGEDANVSEFLKYEKPDIDVEAAKARFEVEFPKER